MKITNKQIATIYLTKLDIVNIIYNHIKANFKYEGELLINFDNYLYKIHSHLNLNNNTEYEKETLSINFIKELSDEN